MRKIFVAALAFLALVGCKENKQKADATEQTAVESVTEGDLAYVNVDYVLAESEIFKTEGIALRDKTEKTQQKWAKKEQELQKRAASMQTAAQKEGKELEEESIVFQNRMNDLLMRAVQEINADKKFKMIVQASALLDAEESLNISEQVLAKVNELYKAEKAKK